MLSETVLVQAERTEAEGFCSLMSAVSDEVKCDLGIESTRIAGAPAWSCRAIVWPLFNRGIGLGLFEPFTPMCFDHVEGFYQAKPHALEASPMASSLNLDELKSRGYAVGLRRPKFIRSSEPRRLPPDIEVTIASVQDAESFAKVMVQSFGLPEEAAGWAQSVVETPYEGRVCVLAQVAGRPAGSGFLFCSGGVGWLGGGCCLPEFRGRGVQKALIEVRSSVARDIGAAWVTSETNPDSPDAPNLSRHNMLRSGFEHAYDRPQYIKGF